MSSFKRDKKEEEDGKDRVKKKKTGRCAHCNNNKIDERDEEKKNG